MFKNALVSVSDKTGLVEFISPLVKQGMRVVATGGTASYLKKTGIAVKTVEEQTYAPEVMGGRVKSLHPRIHIPLLARGEIDKQLLEKENLQAFDLLICNLYPFEKTPTIENIDVGGPTLLRAGAKNFQYVTVVCDPLDYPLIAKNGKPNLEKRKHLAGKVFSVLADYNKSISKNLNSHIEQNEDLYLQAKFFKTLRYGENPGQKAKWLTCEEHGLHNMHQHQGKELSFNNLKDINSAVNMVKEFQKPCCVAVKHNNPCGVAISNTIDKAMDLALKADPVSVFGGMLAVNRKIDKLEAQKCCSIFLSGVIAHDYSPSALEVLSAKKNLQVIKWSDWNKVSKAPQLHSIAGGVLLQEAYVDKTSMQSWKIFGDKPSLSVIRDLNLAWKVCAHLKSNAISVVMGGQTLGLGMGQVSRIQAVEGAVANWKKFHADIYSAVEASGQSASQSARQSTSQSASQSVKIKKNNSAVVLASDGFFPFADSVEVAGKAGVKWIIQPGGSVRDKEILEVAKKLSINMIFTGQRCFLH